MPTKRLAGLVHSRGDGFSSPYNSSNIHGMILEEYIHCQARTWVLKICKVVKTTSRPGMPHTIDEPVLLDFLSIVVIPLVDSVRMTTRNPAFVVDKRQ